MPHQTGDGMGDGVVTNYNFKTTGGGDLGEWDYRCFWVWGDPEGAGGGCWRYAEGGLGLAPEVKMELAMADGNPFREEPGTHG